MAPGTRRRCTLSTQKVCYMLHILTPKGEAKAAPGNAQAGKNKKAAPFGTAFSTTSLPLDSRWCFLTCRKYVPKRLPRHHIHPEPQGLYLKTREAAEPSPLKKNLLLTAFGHKRSSGVYKTNGDSDIARGPAPQLDGDAISCPV